VEGVECETWDVTGPHVPGKTSWVLKRDFNHFIKTQIDVPGDARILVLDAD